MEYMLRFLLNRTSLLMIDLKIIIEKVIGATAKKDIGNLKGENNESATFELERKQELF